MMSQTAYYKNDRPINASVFTQVALDPARSVVIKACAGSGKTWLLTSRMVRLLLAGVAPHQILAITFTNKAAQEMRDRVIDTLRQLADSSEPDAVAALVIRGMSESEAQAAYPQAQRLYDEILGQSQSLQIYTFHAWFARLLRAAPAGLDDIGVMRDATLTEDSARLVADAWDAFYQRLNEEESLRHHYLSLVRQIGSFSTATVLNNAIAAETEWRLFERYCAEQGESMLEMLKHDFVSDLGLAPNATEHELYARWQVAFFADGHWQRWLSVWQHASPKTKAKEMADQLVGIENITDPIIQYRQLTRVLALKANGAMNEVGRTGKTLDGVLERAGVDKAVYLETNQYLNDQLLALREFEKDRQGYRLHLDVIPCVNALLEVYQNIKQRQKVLDFNDLEYQCLTLLSDERSAAYVQIQLDARYRHLLFDEFQDTSPLQWQVISSWLTAYGADSSRPSVFVVGDLKQSIYRFRKADARVFAAAEQLLVSDYNADVLETHLTRRNSQAVLDWVNQTFDSEYSKLIGFKTQQTASAITGGVAYLQQLTQTTSEAEQPELELVNTPVLGIADGNEVNDNELTRDWLSQPKHTIDVTLRDDEAMQLAQVIQSLVTHHQLEDGLGGTRTTQYQDIMVLLQNRLHLPVYERLLREAGIPFVSSRRGGLLDKLEAMDVMAWVAWLMDPHDDLAFLHMLRSPLFGVDESFMQTLAHARAESKQSLWHTWLEQSEPQQLSMQQQMHSWLNRAPHMTPHEVMDMIYTEGDVYQRYAQMVPPWENEQVQSNLRVFLHLALSLNSGRYPNLQTYWQALKVWQDQKKDAPSEAAPIESTNAVQILTAHGSKGLEAPIVLVIDVKETSEKDDGYHWLVDWPVTEPYPTHFSLVAIEAYKGRWRAHRWEANQQRAAIEKWNVLYVAMTRAEQVLIMSSAQKSDAVMKEGASVKLHQHLSNTIHQVEHHHLLPIETYLKDEMTSVDTLTSPTNEWLNRFISPPVVSTPLAEPSISDDAVAIMESVDQSHQREKDLGTLWHALMEYRSQNWYKEPPTVHAFARKHKVGLADAQLVMDWADHILSLPEVQPWFDPDLYDEAHNETSMIDKSGVVMRVDRWVRVGDRITVIDYKSGWQPDELADYRAQLMLYVETLQSLFHDCEVVGVLLRADGYVMQLHKDF